MQQVVRGDHDASFSNRAFGGLHWSSLILDMGLKSTCLSASCKSEQYCMKARAREMLVGSAVHG